MTQPTNVINYGGLVIPGPQAQPPAGHDDLAFRPACSQLTAVAQATGITAYTVTLPDGTSRTLGETPPQPLPQAHAWLDASGLCKVGGVDTPVIYTNQLPQQATAAPIVGQVVVAAPAPVADGGPNPMVVGALGLAALGAIAMAVAVVMQQRRGGQGSSLVTPPPAPETAAGDAPQQPTGDGADKGGDGTADLIDKLFGG